MLKNSGGGWNCVECVVRMFFFRVGNVNAAVIALA